MVMDCVTKGSNMREYTRYVQARLIVGTLQLHVPDGRGMALVVGEDTARDMNDSRYLSLNPRERPRPTSRVLPAIRVRRDQEMRAERLPAAGMH